MSREKKSQLAAGIIILGFFIAVAWHYILGAYLQYPAPYNTFLFRGQDLFSDFFEPYIGAPDPYSAYMLYFPVLYWVINLLRTLTLIPALALYLTVFTYIFIRCCVNFFQPAGWVVGVCAACLSLPFLAMLDRGNLEGMVFLSILGFVTFYRSRPRVALGLLIFAISAKLFPAIFALLYLSDKRYREIIIAGVVSLGLTLLAYQLLPGGLVVNISNHLQGMTWYQDLYAANNRGLGYGHSLLGAAKFLLLAGDPFANYRAFAAAANLPIMWLGLIGGILTAAYVVWVESAFWKKLALIVCSMNLLPFISPDYKLIYLFLPLFYWLNEDKPERSDGMYGVLLALLLIPKNYWRLPEWPMVSSSVLLNPLLMLVLVGLIVVQGLQVIGLSGRKLPIWKLAGVGLTIGLGVMGLTVWQQSKNADISDRAFQQLMLAKTAESQADWALAFQSYRIASVMQPMALEPRLRLVELLEKTGNFQDSYPELKTILTLDDISMAERTQLEDKVRRDLYLRGEQELARHELSVAANTFASLKAQFPQAGDALKGECEVLLAQQDMRGGLIALDQWIRAEPEAEAYLSYQDWPGLRISALMGVKLMPTIEKLNWQLAGWSSLNLGDWNAAKAQFIQSLKLGPTRWSFEGLVLVYQYTGEIDAQHKTIRKWQTFTTTSAAAQRYAQSAGMIP